MKLNKTPTFEKSWKKYDIKKSWSFWSWCLRITLTRYKGTFFLRPYNPPRREREFPQKVVYTRGILPKMMAEKFRLMMYTKLPYNTLE